MNKRLFDSEKMQYRGVSAAITAVVLLVIILVNVLIAIVGERFNTTIDLTANKVFALSSQSKEYLKKLDKPVEILVMVEESMLERGGGYYTQIKTVIDQYARCNPKVTVKYIDPITNPTLVARYTDIQLEYYDILISSDRQTSKTSVSELFNVAYTQSGDAVIRSSKAEQEITSAIMRVTSQRTIGVTLLLGQEQTYSAELVSLLEKNGYKVTSDSLTTGQPLPEADIAILLEPKRDLTASELKIMEDFLMKGKTLIYAPSGVAILQPNLDAFLAQWGIAVGSGVVVETDPQRVLNNMPYLCTVDYTAEDYTDKLGTAKQVAVPMGRELSVLFESQSGCKTTTLLSYSKKSCVLPAGADENWKPTEEIMGTRPAAIRAVSPVAGKADVTSKLFVLASSAALDGYSLQSPSMANAEYLLNILATVTQRTDIINIAPKTIGGKELGINGMQITLLGVIFVVAVPLALLIMGLVCRLRRRNR